MELIASIAWLPSRSDPGARPARTAARPLVAVDDETLMQRYQDGDDDAFSQLYSRHRSSLLRFARHLCARHAEADEVFQETWIAVVAARARYRAKSRFVTWLFSIAHRRAADAYRRFARSRTDTGLIELDDLPAPTAEPSQCALDDARERALRLAIAALPFEQREVFLLRAEAGLDLRDIARLTHARPEATKSRLRYALRALRRTMKDWT
jgi:RNA polymerase sigma-70 factor (ECF subfamily)